MKAVKTGNRGGMTDVQQGLVEEHLWLVGWVLRTLGPMRYEDREDVLAEGRLALCRAASRFKPAGRATFHTYAEHVIRGGMIDALRSHSRSRGTIRRHVTGGARVVKAVYVSLDAPRAGSDGEYEEAWAFPDRSESPLERLERLERRREGWRRAVRMAETPRERAVILGTLRNQSLVEIGAAAGVGFTMISQNMRNVLQRNGMETSLRLQRSRDRDVHSA